MLAEERRDPPPRIGLGRFVVEAADQATEQLEAHRVMVIHEGMAGVGVFLDVVVDALRAQRLLQARRRAG